MARFTDQSGLNWRCRRWIRLIRRVPNAGRRMPIAYPDRLPMPHTPVRSVGTSGRRQHAGSVERCGERAVRRRSQPIPTYRHPSSFVLTATGR